MIVLNSNQKKVLLRVYATGRCGYQEIDFISTARFEAVPFDRLKYVAELKEMKATNPEAFYKPIESITQVELNQSQKEQIRQILKNGYISDEALSTLDWLPQTNAFDHLSNEDFLFIFDNLMGRG